MSKVNHSNRPHVSVNIGALSATKEIGVLHAHKKMRIWGIRVTDVELIGADVANYVDFEAQIDGAAQATVIANTAAGKAAREAIDLAIPEAGLYLEAGELLSVLSTVNGTGALTNASIHVDAEVIGN